MGIARIAAPHHKYLPEILSRGFVNILLVLCLSFLITRSARMHHPTGVPLYYLIYTGVALRLTPAYLKNDP